MSLANHRAARPIEEGGRSIGWWAAILGVVIVTHLVVAGQVAAVYLRSRSATWPPLAVEPPGVWSSLAAVGLLAVAALCASVAVRRTVAGRSLSLPLLVAGGLLAAGAAAIRGAVTIFSDHPVAEHAYWSIRWFLGGMDVVLIVALALMLLVSAWHVRRGVIGPETYAELPIVALWAWATAVFIGLGWLVQTGVTLWWGGPAG